VAHGAQVDGVEAAQLLQDGVREYLAGGEIAVAAHVVGLGLIAEPRRGRGGLQNFQAFAHDLGTSAIAGDNGYSVHSLLLVAD
jgi:hypothetical protein